VYTHVEACPCRHLKGEDITSLKPRELILLEEALENGYSSIRERLVSTKIVIIYFIEGLGIAIKKLIKSFFFSFFFFFLFFFFGRWTAGGRLRKMYQNGLFFL
jgi:hypothetical protein